MAFLLGVVATYGRLSAERELIAIKMARVHPGKLALPGLLVAVPLVLFTNHLLGEISPDLKFQQRSLLVDADVSRFLASMKGRNVLPSGNNSLVGENQGDCWRNVLLTMEGDQKITAEEARLECRDDALVIRMKNASVQTENGLFRNGSPTYTLPLAELFPKQPRDRGKPKYLRSSEMQTELAGTALDAQERDEYRYEIHRRHALSATYLVLLLLGIPTGLVLR